MNTITLDMKMEASEALRLWSEAQDDAHSSAAKKAAFWKRYTLLRNREARSGSLPPEPVVYSEGATGPVRHLVGETDAEISRHSPNKPGGGSGENQSPAISGRGPRSESQVPPATDKRSRPPATERPRRSGHPISEPNTPTKTEKPMNRKPHFTDADKKEIGRRASLAYRELGYEQLGGAGACAKRCGLWPPDVASLRSGAKVTEGKVERFAKGLGISADWLATGQGSMVNGKAVRYARGTGKNEDAPTGKKRGRYKKRGGREGHGYASKGRKLKEVLELSEGASISGVAGLEGIKGSFKIITRPGTPLPPEGSFNGSPADLEATNASTPLPIDGSFDAQLARLAEANARRSEATQAILSICREIASMRAE